jgi:hypothetical protein
MLFIESEWFKVQERWKTLAKTGLNQRWQQRPERRIEMNASAATIQKGPASSIGLAASLSAGEPGA